MRPDTVFYRPEWTCGRYNADAEVAIYYNLLEGMSYLFEDYSALVVAQLLALPRNGSITIEQVAKITDIAIESIIPFFEELQKVGLITDFEPTKESITIYRKRLRQFKQNQSQLIAEKIQKQPLDVSSAEMMYTEKAGGITSVMFELTYNCSERCIHCYNIGATRNDNEISHRGDLEELTLDDYKRIIDQLYEKGLIKVCLSGGDPFSKPFAWEIIDYLYYKGIATDIYTNGQRIVNDVDNLANYYPRLVGVSIYSGFADTHDKITRTRGSWSRSVAVLDHLSELAVPIVIKCCVMRPNVCNYYTVLDLAHKYGTIVQYEVNVSDSIEGDKCVSEMLRLTSEMLDVVLQDENTPMYVGEKARNYGSFPIRKDLNACGAGKNSFCITPNGELIPCCALHLPFGNLKAQAINNLLNGNKGLEDWQNLTLEQYEECGDHDYCRFCNLCPGHNYSENNMVTKAGENNCFMARCRFNLAEKLKKGQPSLSKDELINSLKRFDNNVDYFHLRQIFNKIQG